MAKLLAEALARSLEGHEEEITMMHLRKHPGDVMQQVQLGKTYYITHCGKRIAELRPLEPDALELAAAVRRVGMAGR